VPAGAGRLDTGLDRHLKYALKRLTSFRVCVKKSQPSFAVITGKCEIQGTHTQGSLTLGEIFSALLMTFS
jgi:hypothetical protein